MAYVYKFMHRIFVYEHSSDCLTLSFVNSGYVRDNASTLALVFAGTAASADHPSLPFARPTTQGLVLANATCLGPRFCKNTHQCHHWSSSLQTGLCLPSHLQERPPWGLFLANGTTPTLTFARTTTWGLVL